LAPGAQVDRQLEEVDALHAGHALVAEQERDLLLAELELPEHLERARPRVRADHLVLVAVARRRSR
jgi:hypothetical protein